MSEEKELPEGWIAGKLEDICHIERGITFPASVKRNKSEPGNIVCLRTANVQNNVDWNNLIFIPTSYVTNENKLLRCGDILISMANSRELVGKVSFINQLVAESTFGGFIAAIRSYNPINPKYLFYYLRSSFTQNKLRESASQTVNIANLSLEGIYSVPLILAPLPEQQRIVEAIEQQFSCLDAAIALLRQTQKKLKLYRASVLKAAVEGELTAQWRAAHPEIEPASKLLKRILAERRAKWEEEQLAKMREKGIVPKDDKWKQAYKEPQGTDASGLMRLPEGWCWVTVEQLADVGTGATPLRSRLDYYEHGTIPWVTSGALNEDKVTSANQFLTERALKETNVKVFPIGTLLLAMYGEGKTRGKVSELQIESTTNQACAAIVFSSTSIICQPYVKKFLQSNYLEIRTISSGGVQPNLNLQKVKDTVVSLPSLTEQQQIVSLIEERLSIINELETTIEKALKQAERQRQSILHQAFTGKLVPQDPSDEPASVLLERIQQERQREQQEKPKTQKVQPKTARSKKVPRMAKAVQIPDRPVEPIDVTGLTQGNLWEQEFNEVPEDQETIEHDLHQNVEA